MQRESVADSGMASANELLAESSSAKERAAVVRNVQLDSADELARLVAAKLSLDPDTLVGDGAAAAVADGPDGRDDEEEVVEEEEEEEEEEGPAEVPRGGIPGHDRGALVQEQVHHTVRPRTGTGRGPGRPRKRTHWRHVPGGSGGGGEEVGRGLEEGVSGGDLGPGTSGSPTAAAAAEGDLAAAVAPGGTFPVPVNTAACAAAGSGDGNETAALSKRPLPPLAPGSFSESPDRVRRKGDASDIEIGGDSEEANLMAVDEDSEQALARPVFGLAEARGARGPGASSLIPFVGGSGRLSRPSKSAAAAAWASIIPKVSAFSF